MIVHRHSKSHTEPIVICDQCHEAITDLSNGIAMEIAHVESSPVFGIHVHKGSCDRQMTARNTSMRAWIDLDWLLGTKTGKYRSKALPKSAIREITLLTHPTQSPNII